MKIKSTFSIMLIAMMVYNFSCKKEPLVDWAGDYIGKDFISRATNGGSPQDEDPLDNTSVEISAKNDNNEPKDANLIIRITLPFSTPQSIILYGVATSDPSFKLLDHETHNHQDSNNNQYSLYFNAGIGNYINDSKDVMIVFTEKRVYDNAALQQNFTATHTIRLNKI